MLLFCTKTLFTFYHQEKIYIHHYSNVWSLYNFFFLEEINMFIQQELIELVKKVLLLNTFALLQFFFYFKLIMSFELNIHQKIIKKYHAFQKNI